MSRAASHCCAIHPGPRKVGSSALAKRWTNPDRSATCEIRVVLPTCLAPVMIWRKRRGSCRRRSNSAAWGRMYDKLLNMLSKFTQRYEQMEGSDPVYQTGMRSV